ncbi:uncharacterized protein C9orf40 homolog [Sinocyclocheilus anshuiensis]|uniref:uncharacterized protein C9orf40 homolog n=1 Tax=Sinocyclocheilus anshuiensis TaxID=1608454 RepID=UPI0007B80EA6|nr:PREDICTED: uncharacterized protein C9orf40 homolog [Sinocyclocheilus anshuiensis]
MTKRRAENILPPEIPHKRCFRSLSDNDKPVGGVNVIQNAIPSSLLTLAGQRCRKRPSYREDSLDTDNLPRKVAANRVNSVLADRNTCQSRTFEDGAGRPVTRRSSRALQTHSNKQTDEENNITAGDKVMHTDEDLSPFNSFQFWRDPLPELDLALLETEPSTGSHIASSTKDLEAMET